MTFKISDIQNKQTQIWFGKFNLHALKPKNIFPLAAFFWLIYYLIHELKQISSTKWSLSILLWYFLFFTFCLELGDLIIELNWLITA